MNSPKDLNAPSRWNMRIWDDDKKEWLCQSDKEALTYYGFDITGGETTEFQGLPKWHPDRHLIWEQSTGLADKNGKEIYEGDIIQETILADDTTDGTYRYEVYWDEDTLCWSIKGISDIDYHLRDDLWETNASREVIGNIHEPPKDFRPEHLKRMGVSISKGGEE